MAASSCAASSADHLLCILNGWFLRSSPIAYSNGLSSFEILTPLHFLHADGVRVAARMAAFPPERMVTRLVLLSRCLYAQLALQQVRYLWHAQCARYVSDGVWIKTGVCAWGILQCSRSFAAPIL